MLRKALVAFTAITSLAVGAAALTPAMANYSKCDEQPNADSCSTYAAPAPNGRAVIGHAYNRHVAHESSRGLGSPFTAAHGMTAY